MKSYDPAQLKFGISQKYGIPESEIDESILALYVLVDSVNDKAIENLTQQKAELNKSLTEMRELQAKKLKPITYEGPKTAFWGNFGSKGIIAVCSLFALIVVSSAVSSWYSSRELVKNLEILKSHVQVTDEGYFIHKNSYTVTKEGILIKP